ncbi:M15 family metallopeptidase [Nocardioides alcanivorans]|uniref:M15 family metallopeptidase n=1 Tax=Nocardioides alcanivorans TaxID=2897352 RepID=UPI001F24077B|nr:M15 family metallopeptidase [Nocardioides alcanivorans]
MGTRRRTTVAVLGALVLVAGLVACGDEGTSDRQPAEEKSSQVGESLPPTPESSTAAPADPDHAVDPPGPLTEPLASADIMLVSLEDGPLAEDLLAAIEKVKGVQTTELIDLGNVALENTVVNVAAVDPASYRRFTPAGQAEEIWGRVAGGELAIGEELGQKVQGDESFVKLGNDKEAPKVHVGAYTDQVLTVDIVVNRAWGETLGLVRDNALLISTGINSPQKVRKRLKSLVEGKAAVQMLDAVARSGIDLNATQTAYLTGGSVARAVGSFSYKAIGGGRIAPDPAWVAANIRTEEVPILGKVTCHKAMLPQMRAALDEIVQRGLADKIHPGEYAGCYYPRFIANSTSLSLHSFGIAFDVNVPGNQRGTAGEIDRQVVSIFKKWGFGWGGDWSWTDPMHFEMNAIVEAR